VLERDIEAYLVKLALERGLFTRKLSFIGHKGAPDRLVISPAGTCYWVELKARRGEKPLPLAPLQVREHAALRAAYQQVYVVSSIEEVERLMSAIFNDNLSFFESLKNR